MASDLLFPPILSTYQPVFIQGEVGKIYFTFSSFNSKDDINNYIQLSIVNPDTNRTVLDTEKYPNEIKLCEIHEQDDLYWIEFSNTDAKLELNQYYKAQLRFCEKGVAYPNPLTQEWLNQNEKFFSEWSSTTLVRNISKPSLEIYGLNEKSTTELDSLAAIYGSLSFKDDIENEKLNTYRVILKNKGKILDDSGILYSNFAESNQFYYVLKYIPELGISYNIEIIYTTINGYTDTKKYNIYIREESKEHNEKLLSFKVKPDNDSGSIQLTIECEADEIYEGTLRLYRTSYLSGFKIWDILVETDVSFGSYYPPYIWTDITAESDVVYKYAIRFEYNNNYCYKTSDQIMISFDDIYLENKNVQFKIKFNPNISGFKRVVTESVTNTLGGKYPFIRRNGNNDYRQFSLSGLITFLSDPDINNTVTDSISNTFNENKSSLFLSREEAFKTALDFYNTYNLENGINPYNDYIFEKLYRDKAIDFLCDNTVKLFKSSTEGNILVKLTNISFTPTTNLGRRTYSFTATATEIDECTIDNYYKYGIITQPYDEYEEMYVLNGVKLDGTTVYIDPSEFTSRDSDNNILILNQIKKRK